MVSARDFYDQMAPFYHLIFPQGFDASIERHGSALDAIIRNNFGPTADTVLDVSCGIGTQALGLAQLGYQVTASDLAPKAIARAKQEATRRNLSIEFSVADMREVSTVHARQYHVVLSADNSVPHLLTDDDILAAFRSFYRCCRPDGGCIITVRDYEHEDVVNSSVITYGLRQQKGMRYLVFQVRDPDGPFLDISMFFVQDDGSDTPKTHVMRARYYAITIPRLMQLFEDAGFVDVARNDTAFFQPVLTGKRFI
jgi:ubiquinone/menaquinone biosynthesis C-methylase UbiE